MKQYQISYKNKEKLMTGLSEIKKACKNTVHSDITFYLTWTQSAKTEIETVTQAIENLFPNAAYYGNEASGNIAMGNFTYGINITCYVFEGKTTGTELVWVEKDTELSTLEDLWNYCNSRKGLCGIELIPAISYLEVLGIDRNVPDIAPDILIFGGASVNYDDATFGADIIAKGHPMTREGMAVMLYFGTDLKFRSSDILGWKGLGRLMEVTGSTGKEIKEIDHVPAFSVYEKYLNLTLDDKDTLVFPLIAEEDGNEFIRTPQIINPDKSMLMFANIPEGTHVRISYGDKNTILGSINDKAAEIAMYGPEAIKAYSCAARRLFWGDSEVGKETSIFQKIAPVCGFYTGGEILRFGKKLRVLNQTLALVSFREGDGKENSSEAIFKHEEDKSLLSRLTYFAERIVDEESFAKQQMMEALEAAEVANRSKSTFLFNMSHDIRTPMNAISGFTALARKYADNPDKVKTYMDKIDISGQQLLSLINQVLEMSRIESGKIEFDDQPVNIREQFEAMVTIIIPQAESKGLEFNYGLENIRHYDVKADDSRMGQITLNVVGNAIKYTPEGGRIDFRLKEIPSRKEGYASYIFSVEDTGIGMSKEYLQEIFVPFSREKNSTVSKIQGTGLGMPIVKDLVDLKGGDINITSEPGKGSRFDITLDFEIVDEKDYSSDGTEEVSALSLKGKRVLLVEDNEMNREIAVELLEEYGILVEEAEDGNDAVLLVKEKGPDYYDFILMDIQMPKMNGYEATKVIRDMYSDKHIPIIALSANAFSEDKEASLEAGMDDHVAKPISIKALFSALARFL